MLKLLKALLGGSWDLVSKVIGRLQLGIFRTGFWSKLSDMYTKEYQGMELITIQSSVLRTELLSERSCHPPLGELSPAEKKTNFQSKPAWV